MNLGFVYAKILQCPQVFPQPAVSGMHCQHSSKEGWGQRNVSLAYQC